MIQETVKEIGSCAFELQLQRDALIRHQRRVRSSQLLILFGRCVVIVGTLLFWELGSGRFFDPFFISSPSAVAQAMVRLFVEERALLHIRFTVTEMSLGYLFGATAGVIVALLLTIREEVYIILEPIILAVYGIPRIALAPLIIMWFGIGITPKVILAALLVFFIVLVNTVSGIRAMDPWLIYVSRTLGAKRWQILTKILLPSIAPYIITSLRLTLPMALLGAIVGEFISANRGMGFLISKASNALDTSLAIAAILVLLAVVMVLNALITLIEKRSFLWIRIKGPSDSNLIPVP